MLDLFRCLWKMNHGGLHRERSRGETHLVRWKKQKKCRDVFFRTLKCLLFEKYLVRFLDKLPKVTMLCDFTDKLIMRDKGENMRRKSRT